MPTSPAPDPAAGRNLAVTAEGLFLANLLLLPGLAFLALLWLHFRHAGDAPPLARCHLRQTVSASLWGGLLLVVVNLTIVLMGGYTAAYTWVVVILYFTMVHSSFILLGVLGLARAMAGRAYRYPLVGCRHCCDGVPE